MPDKGYHTSILRSNRGIGILEALVALFLLAIATQTIFSLSNNLNSAVANVAARAGLDSLNASLLSILTEQSLCSQRLTPSTPFSAVDATSPTGMPLSFIVQANAPAVGVTPKFSPGYNLIINSIYFANATLVGTGREPAGF